MRPIDADTLVVELEKDEAFFDKEAEEARENSNNCTEGYANAMQSRVDGIRDAIIEIYDAPTIDVDRPQGEWFEMYRNGFGNMIYMCSKCNFHATKSNFCPNCGADMRGENNE